MSERIAYQHNREHILKFAGMEKLSGEQVADELNRLYTDNAELKEKIAALEREVEELRLDAERYRWLRDPCSDAERVVLYSRDDFGRGLLSYTMLDAAIDAAMQEEQSV